MDDFFQLPVCPTSPFESRFPDTYFGAVRKFSFFRYVPAQVATSTVCSHCKMTIESEEQFYQHLQKHCGPASAGGGQVTFPTSCTICRQTLVSDVEVKVHVHYHLSRLKEPAAAVCGTCNRYKSSASSPCAGCNAAPERCPDCGATFDAFGSLQHHMTTVHRKPFHCFKCKVRRRGLRRTRVIVRHFFLRDDSFELGLRDVRFSPQEFKCPVIGRVFYTRSFVVYVITRIRIVTSTSHGVFFDSAS